MAQIFLLGTTDYSHNVVANDYEINSEDVFQEWTDGGQNIHRDVVRQRIVGKFNMYFHAESSFKSFINALASARTQKGTYLVSLKVNNYNVDELTQCEVFLTFKPKRHRDMKWNDAFDTFEVTIQES